MFKKFMTVALVIVLSTIFAVSAFAEHFVKNATENTISIQSNSDKILGVYFNANCEIAQDERAKVKNNNAFVVSKPGKGKLQKNRMNKAPRFAKLNMNSFEFSGRWGDEEAYTEFAGDAQALFNATLVASTKKGKTDYFTHRLWNKAARKVAICVFQAYVGGRKVKVSYILNKDGERVYGLELVEQTVTSGKKPTATQQPQDDDPTPQPQDDVDPAPVWEDQDDPTPAPEQTEDPWDPGFNFDEPEQTPSADVDPAPVWEDEEPAPAPAANVDPAPVWEDEPAPAPAPQQEEDSWDADFNFGSSNQDPAPVWDD